MIGMVVAQEKQVVWVGIRETELHAGPHIRRISPLRFLHRPCHTHFIRGAFLKESGHAASLL